MFAIEVEQTYISKLKQTFLVLIEAASERNFLFVIHSKRHYRNIHLSIAANWLSLHAYVWGLCTCSQK